MIYPRIGHYFPNLSGSQHGQLEQFGALIVEWNAKVNLISRKDEDNLEVRHLIHSLSLMKTVDFKSGNLVLDLGTGGGFPGIPLAIAYPEVEFLLVDSIKKKVDTLQSMIGSLGLKNARALHSRVEHLKASPDSVVTRAVAPLLKLHHWTRGMKSIRKVWALKGGDLTEEKQVLPKQCEEYALSDWFEEEFFETKKIISFAP